MAITLTRGAANYLTGRPRGLRDGGMGESARTRECESARTREHGFAERELAIACGSVSESFNSTEERDGERQLEWDASPASKQARSRLQDVQGSKH